MTVVHEIREERDDIYSFWKIVKTIDEDTEVITRTNTKIDETTIIELNERIVKLQEEKSELNKKINKEQDKIDLINLL